jgi:hypothetical protein
LRAKLERCRHLDPFAIKTVAYPVYPTRARGLFLVNYAGNTPVDR